MKKHQQLFVFTGFVMAFLAACPAHGAKAIGQAVLVSGDVSVTSQNGNKTAVHMKSEIYLNDQIETLSGGKVQLMFVDDSVVSIGENSSMVIDEYVYSPGKKEDNSVSLGLVKGVSRFVTGKVTEINPDGFKVKTRMATIGVRGCDVTVEYLANGLGVYVAELPDGTRITIQAADGGETFELKEPGFMMTMEKNGKTSTRRIPADTMRRIISSTRSSGYLSQGTAATGPGTPPPDQWSPDPTHGGDGGDVGDGSGQVSDWSSTTVLLASDSDPAYPIYSDKVYTMMGAGTDWYWEEWAQDVEDLVDGVAQISTIHGVRHDSISGTWPDASTYFSGSPAFLMFAGDAHAYATHNGTEVPRLDGSCSVEVSGGGGMAVWDGSFSMANGSGDDLQIEVVGGTVNMDGTMSGGFDNYTLDFNGQVYGIGTIVGSTLKGRLVGPGAEPTATVGDGTVDHGTASVRWGWGADFSAF